VQSLTPARRYAASNRSATILSMRAEFPTSVRASRMRFRVRVKYSPSFNGTAGGNFLRRAIERVRLPAEAV
jgi:hypothetical protein